MAATRLRGNKQIKPDTITNVEINAAAAIATTKLANGPDFIRRTGSVPFTADQSLGGFKLTNVADPTSAQDAASKAYVDAVASGLDVKDSVRLATDAALPANTAAGSGVGKTLTGDVNGALTVDSIAVGLNEDVLVKNEVTQADNGIYKHTQVGTGGLPYILTRRTDADQDVEVTAGMFMFVEEGTVNADSGWVLTTDDPITVDTTVQVFAQFSGAGSINAGTGLTKSGNTLNANGGPGILASADKLEVELEATTPGLEFDAGGDAGKLQVKVGVNGGIERLAAGIEVKLDSTSLAKSAAGLKVDAAAFIPSTRVTRETPSGVINNSNVTFTLANTPLVGTEEVFLNGILQEPGGSDDYTISGAVITYNDAPDGDDRLRVSYFKAN